MNDPIADFRRRILRHLHDVRGDLGLEPLPNDENLRFADALDSMGMVELLGRLADDCGVGVERVERTAERRFDDVAKLARDLAAAGFCPTDPPRGTEETLGSVPSGSATPATRWLFGASAVLPAQTQSAAELDALLARPPGWFAAHTGISRRHLWNGEDALLAAARAGMECLDRASIAVSEVGVLLVASEAPPQIVGTAAALHHHLGLAPGVAALEIGNACTGFLAALWTARRLVPSVGTALLLTVETPSYRLKVEPGAAGETAALFGDGAAACLLSGIQLGSNSIALHDVCLGTDGGAGDLLRSAWWERG